MNIVKGPDGKAPPLLIQGMKSERELGKPREGGNSSFLAACPPAGSTRNAFAAERSPPKGRQEWMLTGKMLNKPHAWWKKEAHHHPPEGSGGGAGLLPATKFVGQVKTVMSCFGTSMRHDGSSQPFPHCSPTQPPPHTEASRHHALNGPGNIQKCLAQG